MNTLKPHDGGFQLTATYASYVWNNGGCPPIDYSILQELHARSERAVVILGESAEDQEEWEDSSVGDGDATEELLSDPEAMASIRSGEADIAAGRTVAWRDIRRD